MLTGKGVDITSARFKADPFPFYESLRRDHPVASIVLPNRTSAWLISRYDDVVAALKDPRLAKNRIVTSHSDKAFTFASGRRSRVWRGRSPSERCCNGLMVCNSRFRATPFVGEKVWCYEG